MGTVAESTIVVVDDDPRQRKLLELTLMARGFEVRCANDGREGFDLILECLPSLVISDVMMPYVDGVELLRRLRADPRTADLPVIVLTAAVSRDKQRECLSLGAAEYLLKPVSMIQAL